MVLRTVKIDLRIAQEKEKWRKKGTQQGAMEKNNESSRTAE